MALYKQTKANATELALTAIGNIIVNAETASQLDAHSFDNFMGFESLDESRRGEVEMTAEGISAQVRDSADFRAAIFAAIDKDETVVSKDEAEARYETAVDAAVATIMATPNPAAYVQAQADAQAPTGDNVQVIGKTQRGVYSPEAFIDESYRNFKEHAVLANALSAINRESGIELFFPTVILPADQQGQLIEVTQEYFYDKTARTASGEKIKVVKTPLYKAITDRKQLSNNATALIPNGAAAANNDAMLVDATVFPNKGVQAGKDVVMSRPIKAGVKVGDLLELGRRPGQTGVQDETDKLETDISVSALAFTVADGTGTGALNLESNQAVLHYFESMSRNDSNDLSVQGNVTLAFNTETKGWTGAAINSSVDIKAAFSATDSVEITFVQGFAGTINHEHATSEFYFTGAPVIQSIKVDGSYLDLNDATTKTNIAKLTIVGIGYTLDAKKSTANFRTLGRMVDVGTSFRYFYPLTIHSPWSSQKPVSNNKKGGAASVAALGRVNAKAAQGRSIDALRSLEARANELNALDAEVAAQEFPACRQGVKPTIITDSVNVTTQLTVNQSSNAMDDLRAIVCDALTVMADRLVQESNYIAALELYEGADRDFEYVVLTDWRISGFLMKSGDPRTLGQNRKLKIGVSLEKELEGKIYLSVRRSSRLGQYDELSLGGHAMKPSVIQENNNAYVNQANISLIQNQAVDNTAILCPVLGVLSIEGLNTFYVKQ